MIALNFGRCCLLITSLHFAVFGLENTFAQQDRSRQEFAKKEERAYIEFLEHSERQFEKWKLEVERKWKDYENSSRHTWVNYDTSANTKSRVNYKDGYIEIESLVSRSTSDPRQIAADQIAKQVRKIFSKENPLNEALLDGIVPFKDKNVNEQNIELFIKNEIIPKLRPEPDLYSKDTVTRAKFSVHIKMISGYTKVQAQKYLPLIKKYSGKYGLRVPLVLAIIHTESFFNPMAKSHGGAIGLMQLMPSWGAKEAQKYLAANGRIVSNRSLYEPNNNILLGTTYLHILFTKYFPFLDAYLKKRHCSIAGYNWGPDRVQRLALNNRQTSDMAESELYALIKRVAPRETGDFLDRVTQRIPHYKHLLTQSQL